MTCIAYKDGILAADRMTVSYGNSKGQTTKIFQFGTEALGATGSLIQGRVLMNWYREGADPKVFPKTDKDDEWARLIVATADSLIWFDNTPIPQELEGRKFAAFGSGADIALGALFIGASAVEAVGAASEFITDVGCGVDVIDLRGAP